MLAIFGLAVLYEVSRLLPGKLEASIRSNGPLRSRRNSNEAVRDPLLGERAPTPVMWSSVWVQDSKCDVARLRRLYSSREQTRPVHDWPETTAILTIHL